MKHRTTIELDQELLDRARDVLGTSGIRETVETAMQAAIDVELRRRLAARLRTGDGIDTGDGVLAAVRPSPELP